jgi:hypothetical protein
MGIASDKKVADLTLRELRELIREAVLEALDPDYGLELREDVIEALKASYQQKERGEGVDLEDARARLGLR